MSVWEFIRFFFRGSNGNDACKNEFCGHTKEAHDPITGHCMKLGCFCMTYSDG